MGICVVENIIGEHEGVELPERLESVDDCEVVGEVFRAVLVDEGEVEIEVEDGDEVELFESSEVLPVEIAHGPHGLDGDLFVVGTVDIFHEDGDVGHELEAPFDKLVIVGVEMLQVHVLVVLHEGG